jgi:hypothetical protein
LALVVDAVRKSVATPRGADKSGVDVDRHNMCSCVGPASASTSDNIR